jgi:hypothetical protein
MVFFIFRGMDRARIENCLACLKPEGTPDNNSNADHDEKYPRHLHSVYPRTENITKLVGGHRIELWTSCL